VTRSASRPAPASGLLPRLLDLRPGEGPAVAWSFLFFFLLMACWFGLRPLRDALVRSEEIQWLWTGTFLASLAASLAFAGLIGRHRARVFLPWTWRFFGLCLLLFYAAATGLGETGLLWTGRVFYIWASVFNLFAISLFWSWMADVWRPGEGRRLYGLIGLGGTLGALAGSAATALLVEVLGADRLLLVAVALLEAALFCARRLRPRVRDEGPSAPARGRAGFLEGLRETLRQPALLGLAGYLLFLTLAAAFLYRGKIEIVHALGEDRDLRTGAFAWVQTAEQAATILVQAFVTSRILGRLPVAVCLGILPVTAGLGFALLARWPGYGLLVLASSAVNLSKYAFSRPGRELIFTLVGPVARYKSKNFLDLAVYRGGDLLGAWVWTALAAGFGLGLGGLLAAMVPFSLVWAGLSLRLGGHAQRLLDGRSPEARPVPPDEEP